MIRRFSLLAILRISGALAQLVFTLAVTQLTGATESGLFFFGYSVVIILSAFCRLGSEISGLRKVATARAQGRADQVSLLVKARLGLVAGTSALLALCCGLLAEPAIADQFTAPHATRVILLLAAALPALAMLALMSEFLKAVEKAGFGIVFQNLAVPGLATFGILCLSFAGTPNALSVALTVLASAWISLAVSLLIWRGWYRSWQPETRSGDTAMAAATGRNIRTEITHILKEAPALLVVSTTSILMQWIGAVILGFLATPEQVAGYSVAVRLSIVVSIVHSAVTSVVAPRMAAAHSAKNMDRLRLLSHQTALAIFATAVPVLVVLYAFAGLWLSIFGPEFAAFDQTLRILILGQVAAALVGHSGTVLVMSGYYDSARWTSVLALAVMAGLMLTLVPFLGAAGAAIALSGGVVAGHLTGLCLVRKELHFYSLPLRYADFVQLGGGAK